MTDPGGVMVGKGGTLVAAPLRRMLLGLIPPGWMEPTALAQRRHEPAREAKCSPTEVFRRDVSVRFAHCDPAGIVFYPQYFVILNGLMEDWFTEGLGIDFADMVTRRKIGIPTVRIDCTFASPSQLGDCLSLAVAVTRIGGKSISIEVTATAGDEVRLRATQTIVMMCLATRKSIAIPTDIRRALTRCCRREARGGSNAD